ncbi:MAG: sterol desaturase family protein [Bdellovibrionaceae bacterium]|nr:sterol desaturase family protein [Pseudobdellovibrionaceae bacterium]
MNHFERFESYIPVDLTSPAGFIGAFCLVTGIVILRYFAIVGPIWALFYKLRPAWTRRRQIYDELPGQDIQVFEMKWSLWSAVVFGFTGAVMGLVWQQGYTKIYLQFEEYGWSWFFLSPLAMSFVHDFYFYITHRLLHQPWWYRKVHWIHHESLTPSPWASFSFHPFESFLNAIIIPLMVLFIPIHPVMLIAYLTFMTISAVTNHMGFEILPRGAAEHWLGKWLVSGVHHTEHHRYFRFNYALFYTWWDRWLKTEHPKYVQEFNRVLPRVKS